jgi:hypothetical protein
MNTHNHILRTVAAVCAGVILLDGIILQQAFGAIADSDHVFLQPDSVAHWVKITSNTFYVQYVDTTCLYRNNYYTYFVRTKVVWKLTGWGYDLYEFSIDYVKQLLQRLASLSYTKRGVLIHIWRYDNYVAYGPTNYLPMLRKPANIIELDLLEFIQRTAIRRVK